MILKIKYLRFYLYNFIQINTAQNLIIDKHLNWNERTDKTVKNRLKSIFAAKKSHWEKMGTFTCQYYMALYHGR